MATRQEDKTLDEEIKAREKLLAALPAEVKKRVVEIKAYPGEVVSRIKQVNGIFVEFEERH